VILNNYTAEEVQLIFKMIDKGIYILMDEYKQREKAEQRTKIRKIQID